MSSFWHRLGSGVTESLTSLDRFSHQPSLNYKGKRKFETLTGGVASLFYYLVMAVATYILCDRMLKMEEYHVQNYEKPLTEEEMKGIGSVNLGEMDFYIGMTALYYDENGKLSNVPLEVGRVRAYTLGWTRGDNG